MEGLAPLAWMPRFLPESRPAATGLTGTRLVTLSLEKGSPATSTTRQVHAPHDARPAEADHVQGAQGIWSGDESELVTDPAAMREAIHDIHHPVAIVERDGGMAVASGGRAVMKLGSEASVADDASALCLPLRAFAPALPPAQLGDATFCRDHSIRLACMAGSMAIGIASVELVEAIAKAGMLASYGAAGQRIDVITRAIDRLQASLGDLPYAFNLIHSPNEPAHEMRVVELYLKRGVKRVEASAYLDLTLPVVRYRLTGLHRGADGQVIAPNQIIAKASRVEVASRWFSPAPARLVDELVRLGHITRDEAELSRHIPMANDMTAEADSGGHTDNRPAITLIPTFIALRDRLQREHGFDPRVMPLRIGAAGGIATPMSAAAAFAMGAAYIVTGSINQACVESGSSEAVRKMLAEAQQADVAMAPAADMFEMGVKLQVLKRGTMFPMRAGKLYEIYRTCASLEEIPAAERANLEKTIFRASLDDIWKKTREFFLPFDPAQVERAEQDPKHRMALVFRWYLGLSSRWANAGEPTRVMDYQVWCGPAMGAFNEWTRGSFLEKPANRKAAVVAMNLMHGAAVVTRINALQHQGAHLDAAITNVSPVEL